jgi:hypothetical protein
MKEAPMSDIVTVKVLREHSGDSGHHAENSTYPTTLAHARELRAQGLAAFDETKAKADETRDADQSEPTPANKAEPKPRNKGASK